MKYRFTIAACARWETDSILEWIAYHRLLGFEHIYLYCNDDDPTELYERLAPVFTEPTPFVTFVHYPFQGMQGKMYKHFLGSFAHETEWFMFLDIDEFLVLKSARYVSGFMRLHEFWCDALYFNWLFFGHNGFEERPKGSVLLQYTLRDAQLNHYTKMMTRTASLDIERIVTDAEAGFWHDWGDEIGGTLRRLNVIGDTMAGYYEDFPNKAREYLDADDRQERILSTAAVYHFAFRSLNDIRRRLERGIAGDFHGQLAFKKVQDDGEIAAFLGQFARVEDTFLRDRWREFLDGGWRSSLLARPPAEILSRGRPATQSSVSEWSREPTPEADATRAVSGEFSGWYNCHTDIEDQPWWRVDLGAACRIGEVRVFNRTGEPWIMQRTRRFRLQVSDDDTAWKTVFEKTDDTVFGGIDGEPFVWTAA
ncbi:MAG: glycosyltransferase family 2 protein, partial [Acetobacteraceae bacterium]